MVGIAVDGRPLGGVIYKAREIQLNNMLPSNALFSPSGSLVYVMFAFSALLGYKQLHFRAPRVRQGLRSVDLSIDTPANLSS